MKLIPLSKFGKNKGKYFAKVDDHNYDYLIQYNWYAMNNGHGGIYCARKENGVIIMMHSQIMKPPKNMICDHINHDGLDCQEHNMRNCSYSQNNLNKKSSVNSTSQYLGVFRGSINKKWIAQIVVNKKQIYLGSFNTEEEAAKAYDIKAKEYHQEFANLNFK